MFSGGLLSSNLTRSFGKIRNRSKTSSPKKQASKRASVKSKAKVQSEFCLNWDENDERRKRVAVGEGVVLTTAMIARSRFDSHPSYVVASLDKMLNDDYLCLVDSDKQQIKKDNPNTRSTYTLEVKGRIQLASYAGCLLLFGLAILLIGSLLTHLFKGILGPTAIGIGIYAVMISICWLLDNRDRGKRFYHIQDLYSIYATQTHDTSDKAVQVGETKGRSNLKSNSTIPHHTSSEDYDKSNPTNIPEASLPLDNDELNDEDDIVSEQDLSSDIEDIEKPKELKPKKIHPELIKRFSMQELTYDIIFTQPLLKVTDC